VHLAEANSTTSIVGRTPKLKLLYNGNPYTFHFEVMNLTLDVPMSIGTDLMKILGIGYYGLATSWDPPSKGVAESPFKDKVEPNDDPFGTPTEMAHFMLSIQNNIAANEAIPAGSFCTHPDAVIYLDTPDATDSYRPQYPIADTLEPRVQETVERWLKEDIIREVHANV
ncbi:hypothetical protein BD560DRAFT_313478, partial [Blakeslea trispora]